jgi:hypothetical protein
VVAIFAAALAALGNTVVTVVNGALQRQLEANKRDAERALEENKAESSRVFEMIKTGDTETAAKNLSFFFSTLAWSQEPNGLLACANFSLIAP